MDSWGRSQKEAPKIDEIIAENDLEFPGKVLEEKILGGAFLRFCLGYFL